MISRPTTEQILIDCAQELMTGVLPALTDATAQVRVVMLDTVLRNMAARAAHEIAWMAQETDDIAGYVRDVAAAVPAAVPAAGLGEPAAATAGGLHLDDVVDAYCAAGRMFSAALEAAVAAKDAGLIARGEQLLAARDATEIEVMAGWSPTGR